MKVVKIPFLNGLCNDNLCGQVFDSILKDLSEIHSNSKNKIVDLSNDDVLTLDFSGDISKDDDLIYRKSFDLFSSNKNFFLGGDHSMSYYTARAFFDWSQHNGREPALIVFDSHPGLMNSTNNRNLMSKEWLRKLIDDGFNPKNVLLVGIRNYCYEELSYLKSRGIMVMGMQDLFLDYLNKIDAITEFGYGKEVYVSFDMSFVDPAYAPGVGLCEPGGASSKEFLYIVSRIAKMPSLRTIDLVGMQLEKDVNGITSKLGAKILAEFL